MASEKQELTSASLSREVPASKLEDGSIGSSDDVGAIYGINEKALLRKLDFKLLPALTLLYLLSFLDRSNGR